jgi:zinc transport system substrate-binding protein
MLRKIIYTVLTLLVVMVAGIAVIRSTDRTDSSESDRLRVTASYYPLYDFVRNVGGDKVAVVNMTPAGAEPHDYEPSVRELFEAQESDVFIYNGSQLEPWVDAFLTDYKHKAIKASHGIDLIDNKDPHFWLDPVLARQVVGTISDGMVEADPANAKAYKANADKYNQMLTELHNDFAVGLKSCKLDTVISSHDAFSYVADRYNFRVASIAGIEPGAEPTAAKMAELTELVRQKNIKYIFFESLVSPRLANTIAQETSADTLVFDPLEGLSKEDQDKGRDYISVQRDNLANLRTALQCS